MKIHLNMVGCRLNQSEIEAYAQQLQAAGHSLTADPAEADLAIVNTCTVTVSAAADSRKMIRRIARQGAKQVVVTGCWSALEPAKAAQLSGVSKVVSNAEKDELVPLVLGLEQDSFNDISLERVIIPGSRARTRAVIKAQDGCDNRCTFCITTIARGRGRSVPAGEVVQSVNTALRGEALHGRGSQEVVITGVHLGSWGRDFTPPLALHDLVEIILEQTDVPRLRLSSIEPWDVEPPLIELLTSPRVARHLHLPLQSGCASTLRRMARKITPVEYADLVNRVRAVVPEVAITTDVIVGFPGETEQEFEENLAFVQEMAYAGGHTFTYSARPGTAAAEMEGQVPHSTRKERNIIMRNALADSETAYRQQFVGREMDVLWESVTQKSGTLLSDGEWELRGLTDNYLPVWARLRLQSGADLWNKVSLSRLESLTPRGFNAKLVE